MRVKVCVSFESLDGKIVVIFIEKKSTKIFNFHFTTEYIRVALSSSLFLSMSSMRSFEILLQCMHIIIIALLLKFSLSLSLLLLLSNALQKIINHSQKKVMCSVLCTIYFIIKEKCRIWKSILLKLNTTHHQMDNSIYHITIKFY